MFADPGGRGRWKSAHLVSPRSGSTGHHTHWPQHSQLLNLLQCAARREACAWSSQSTRRGRSLLAKGAGGGGGLSICAMMGGATEERERRMRRDEGVGQGRVFHEDTRRARSVEGVRNCARDATQGKQHTAGNVSASSSPSIYFQLSLAFFAHSLPIFESKSDHF